MSFDMWHAVFELIVNTISIILIILGVLLLLFSVQVNPRFRPQYIATSFTVLILGILIYMYVYCRRVGVGHGKKKERKMIRAYHPGAQPHLTFFFWHKSHIHIYTH